ncbi:MAG TPA: flagellin lysine-N-methylase [Bryobacteraceae bacterium]|nr:flagellin lysine-N-methylase [Bryobacteraceae bacterium]
MLSSKQVQPSTRLQPQAYSAFRCIGADCEDTCCIGWGVNVDRPTYEAYQRLNDPELHRLVTINQANTGNDDNYARITISGDGCPFLAEGLCSIQKKLGESYLSKMCATYPRVMSMVDDVLYRSLHMSCPEAARVMLLNPSPISFEEAFFEQNGQRLANLGLLNTQSDKYTDKPYAYFREIRALIIWILQNRAYPLWQRMVILGSLCDQLDQSSTGEIPQVLDGYRDAMTRGLFNESLAQLQPRPASQLEVIVEMIVARISSDFTSQRFRECYQEFMRGLGWTPESSFDAIGERFARAYSDYYAPFMRQHEHMLEHYLVNYAHSRLFPFGPQETSQNLSAEKVVNTIAKQYMLMAVNYSLVKAVLIGQAGFHQAEFGTAHVIKGVQSCAKTFEHSVAFPAIALKILADHGLQTCVSLAILLQN